jgi:hypothetical protein
VKAKSFTSHQVAAFRLTRHHLSDDSRGSLPSICSDVGGIQAQVMSAAELSLWTRRRSTTRAEVQAALWQRRDLVKTTSMRMTLHLIAARDFQLYISAMKSSSMAHVERMLRRTGASAKHIGMMIETVMEALTDGPKTQQELLARAREKAETGMRKWLQHTWSAMRPAILEGLVCYGPPRGAEVTFVRVDQWLPAQKSIDGDAARLQLARRFLAAYGPATHRDFAKWSGLGTVLAKRAFDDLAGVVESVLVDSIPNVTLRRDVAAISEASVSDAPRLLPSFDTFLLAHASKDHVIAPAFYKRVYRNQGWISPVVIVRGRAIAVWFLEERTRASTVDVRPFAALDRRTRAGIDAEAQALGRFLGRRCDVEFASPRAI